MTKCVLKSIKRKNKLYSKYLSDPNKINENLYKKYKNRLNHVIRLSKKKYYEQELITLTLSQLGPLHVERARSTDVSVHIFGSVNAMLMKIPPFDSV